MMGLFRFLVSLLIYFYILCVNLDFHALRCFQHNIFHGRVIKGSEIYRAYRFLKSAFMCIVVHCSVSHTISLFLTVHRYVFLRLTALFPFHRVFCLLGQWRYQFSYFSLFSCNGGFQFCYHPANSLFCPDHTRQRNAKICQHVNQSGSLLLDLKAFGMEFRSH